MYIENSLEVKTLLFVARDFFLDEKLNNINFYRKH